MENAMKTIIEMSKGNIIPKELLSNFIKNRKEKNILDILYFYEQQKNNLTSEEFRIVVQDLCVEYTKRTLNKHTKKDLDKLEEVQKNQEKNLYMSKKVIDTYSEHVLDKLEELQKNKEKIYTDINTEYITPTNKKDAEKDNEYIIPTSQKKSTLQIVIPKDIKQQDSPKKVQKKRKKVWDEEDERESKRIYHKYGVENTLYKTKICNWSHNCKNRLCQYAHTDEEIRCFYFSTTGKCIFGKYCYRVHDTL